MRATMKDLEQGVPLTEVRRRIDARFEDRKELATPTPLPPG